MYHVPCLFRTDSMAYHMHACYIMGNDLFMRFKMIVGIPNPDSREKKGREVVQKTGRQRATCPWDCPTQDKPPGATKYGCRIAQLPPEHEVER